MPGRVGPTDDPAVCNLESSGRKLNDYHDKDHKCFHIRVRAGGIRRWFYCYRVSNEVTATGSDDTHS